MKEREMEVWREGWEGGKRRGKQSKRDKDRMRERGDRMEGERKEQREKEREEEQLRSMNCCFICEAIVINLSQHTLDAGYLSMEFSPSRHVGSTAFVTCLAKNWYPPPEFSRVSQPVHTPFILTTCIVT